MRLLQAARLSRLGDASTGLDKQDEAARRYADAYGHEIVSVAADANVSGDTDPFARPQLGIYLRDGMQFDGIIASNLDRLGRNARHLAKLRNWAEDNGKKLIVISPPLQWPPDPGDLASPIIWDVLARLAEYELQAIKQRTAATRAYLISNDYLVGNAPWGWRIIAKGDHKTLEPDPVKVPYLRGMVQRAMRGDTLLSICRWLDSEGMPPPRGETWHPKSLSQMLRNPALRGRRVGKDGKILLRFDSLITVSEFSALQAALDSRPTRRGPVSAQTAMLTGVARCLKCEGPMYRFRATTKRKDGSKHTNTYYRCKGTDKEPSTCANMIPIELLDQAVNDAVMAYSWAPHMITVVTPGEGHQDEIDEIERDLRELDFDAPDFAERQAALLAERARLKGLPDKPAKVETKPDGTKTVGDVWWSLDDQGKRDWLIKHKWHAYAESNGGDVPTVVIESESFEKDLAGAMGITVDQLLALRETKST